MTSRACRVTSAHSVKERARQPPSTSTRCTVPGCQHLTQRSSGKGLSERYCRSHQEHYRRHGSSWRRSYLLREIAPFRNAARTWLAENGTSPAVLKAIGNLESLLLSSGRVESAFQLRGRPPRERARIALARLRAAGKNGRQLLEIVLTIRATVRAIGPWGNPEFLHVQVAKLAHRLASGTILRNHEGRPYREIYGGKASQFERYPRAEGIFMRIMGQEILTHADAAADQGTISQIVALTRSEGIG